MISDWDRIAGEIGKGTSRRVENCCLHTLSSGISNAPRTASLPKDCLTSLSMTFGSPSFNGAEMSQYDRSDGIVSGERLRARSESEPEVNLSEG